MSPQTRTIAIPLGPGVEVAFQFPTTPLTVAEWNVLSDVLNALRPSLVEEQL